MALELQTVWIGLAYSIPLAGSDQERRGLTGGFGFAAMRAPSIDEAVALLRAALAEGGSELVGFEWIGRLQDHHQPLSQTNAALVEKLRDHPVQFDEFHWHPQHSRLC
jgi:hypothetical protein